ncbi:DUF3368 domain-containing protein [Persicitalea jodogahamensis]|uniref:DUF3368 domain-containing protein n=1 Tax=Persicitalea jodogahamensis TaxID=402147 RepID=A0A8J3D3H1_9BACT|nr:DUF3368 domain-containing protein [Persicitalea jodogahamensis]GHB68470.1 DUF3368 domain-containing protein [Persicitalea jodogahamensis]
MRKVIVDASCLILYKKIDRLDILQALFPELIATQEVIEECGFKPGWIQVKSFTSPAKYLALIVGLGKGEASSIALAMETDHSLLIIDEKKGRKKARELNLEIVGCLGILLLAKKLGVIESVKQIVDLIDNTNFRLSPTLRAKILKEANE